MSSTSQRAHPQTMTNEHPEGLLGPVEWTMYPNDPPDSARIVLLLGLAEESRREAGLQLLAEDREHQLVADNIPLDTETLDALLETAPETHETVLERLWAEKVMAGRGEKIFTLEGHHSHSPATQVTLAVLDRWEGLSYSQYHQIVTKLGERPERLETYLTLLSDHETKSPVEAGAAALRAAELTVNLHP